MVRQSARARKVVSYANDAYKDLDSDTAPGPPDEAASSDEEFRLGRINGTGPAADNDDGDDDGEDDLSEIASSEVESEESDFSDDDRPRSRGKEKASSATPFTPRRPIDEDREPGSAPSVHRKHIRTIDSGKSGARRKTRLLAQGASLNVIRAPDPTVRITYRPGFSKASGKKDRLIQVYGVDKVALEKAAFVRDTWIGMQAVPERAGLALTPFWEEEEEEDEKDEETNREGCGDGHQKGEMLEFEDGEKYLGKEEEPLGCVLGPVGQYQRAVFTRFGVFDLRKVWSEKKAFLLNAGGQVLCMEWATNRAEGCQYLAISTLSEGEPKGKRNAPEEPPAFDRRPSKAAIQIWRFPVDEGYSPSKDPSIALMICHDWGPARTIKWCPLRQKFKDPRILGYLAAVFADGIARIIKVTLPQVYDPDSPDAEGCDFLHIANPAFECHLPDDTITCVAWVSETSVVVGCASGYIAAWELTDDDRIPLIPYLYMPLHQTYITSISTCYPSYPRHIVSSSMDGYSRLASLESPEADTVPNNRSRIAPCAITYIDAIQAGVSIEEGTWVKFFPVRRFFSSTTVCKHGGIVRALAASPVHTCIVSGGTEGEAAFSNPSRRAFHGKIKNYMQTWFRVEYSEATDTLRMTEGFKLEECEPKAKGDNGKQLLTTVFPEQISVSAVCWNTNLTFGGWAAAGLSCGLVRVEDVAIDS